MINDTELALCLIYHPADAATAQLIRERVMPRIRAELASIRTAQEGLAKAVGGKLVMDQQRQQTLRRALRRAQIRISWDPKKAQRASS